MVIEALIAGGIGLSHYSTMYLTLHSFSLKLCSATIDLKTKFILKKSIKEICFFSPQCFVIYWDMIRKLDRISLYPLILGGKDAPVLIPSHCKNKDYFKE